MDQFGNSRGSQAREGEMSQLVEDGSEIRDQRSDPKPSTDRSTLNSQPSTNYRVILLTGGSDKPYALGMATALTAVGISVDFIGSNELSVPELLNNRRVNFLNLRGDQSSDAPFLAKVRRVSTYYAKLFFNAATARAKLFHILWNNKFEHFDRTLLMFYYRLLGKRIVLTAHNVNMRERDGRDSWFNRLSLRIQYRLCHHILVHASAMKDELVADFAISQSRITVIPFGINNTCPKTGVSRQVARERVGVSLENKVLLFFGQIAPYKGLEYLIDAFSEIARRNGSYRLIVAGKVKKGHNDYWNEIQRKIASSEIGDQVIARIEHIPDEEVEAYFKAADALIVPYVRIFQSGLPFLAYSFGLPLIATDVGSLREDIVEGKTGFVCRPENASDLATTINHYFGSELFQNLENRRVEIKKYANERYSWDRVAEIITTVYSNLLLSR